MTPLNFKLTDAARAEMLRLAPLGLSMQLTHVEFGSGNRVPTGSEVALVTPEQVEALGQGSKPSPTQLRMGATFGGAAAYDIREVGVWAGGAPGQPGAFLALYWSQAAGVLSIKSAGDDFIFRHDLSIAETANITVVVDQQASILLALIHDHEVADDPHPQYTRMAEIYFLAQI